MMAGCRRLPYRRIIGAKARAENVTFQSDRRSVLAYLERHALAVSKARLQVLGGDEAIGAPEPGLDRRFARHLVLELTQSAIPEPLQAAHEALVLALWAVAAGEIEPGADRVEVAAAQLQEVQFRHAIVPAPAPTRAMDGFRLLDLQSEDWPQALTDGIFRTARHLNASEVVAAIRASIDDVGSRG